MMYYATIDNKIGSASVIPEGAVEITQEEYKNLLKAKNERQLVTIEDGAVVAYSKPVYSITGEGLKERPVDGPLLTITPPEDIHSPKWEGGMWTEGETAQQKEEREQKEEDEERERLNSINVTRFQAKAAMDDVVVADGTTLLNQVENYMQGEEATNRVKLAWQEASFTRDSNMVNSIGTELGLTEKEIDDLFLAAQEIKA